MVSTDSLVQAGPVPSLCWGAHREGGVWPGEAWGMRYQCSIRAGGGAARHEARRPESPKSSRAWDPHGQEQAEASCPLCT